uniref:Peptidase_M3 domain-containing protein n=1 Tax=Schistocephalus solidus TaxID=70667 RepID=A0A183T8Y9_SCHSO
LMEHFALDTRVTCQYARHFDTGEAPSSTEDVQALLRLSTSRAFGQSVEVLQHLTHAIMDQRMHSGPPDKVLPARPDANGTPPSARFLNGIVREYCDEWLATEETPDFLAGKPIATTHRFGHLAGYGGRYYSYLMARAGAGLIWQKGFAGDPWSTAFGRVGVFPLNTFTALTAKMGPAFARMRQHIHNMQFVLFQRYRDYLLRHGGEQRPAFMLKRLLGDSAEAVHSSSLSPEALASGLFEDVAACEETAKRMFEMDNQPGLKRIV